MGMTLTQKILAAHAGLAEVKAGQLINAKLDIVLGNDITTPVAINEFEKAGFDGVFDKEHIAIVLDHFVPNKDIKIDQVVIGSCTNGRLEDMEAAYNVLKGKHIAKGVRGIIIPATMAVYKECILRGWTTAFIDAGCIVSTPTCGPCLGGYMGILAEGERCVSTTNRNFVGRMGHVKSEVYLASPATAAASALTGCITDPRTV